MSWDEVDDLLQYVASFIAMLPLLRPIDELAYNPAVEIWRAISRIPPRHRPKLINRLEPGSIRSLWRYSMFRYIWDREQTEEAFANFSLLDDFPEEAGQVYTFEGRSEETILRARERLEEIQDARLGTSRFELTEESSKVMGKRFKQYVFLHPESGALYSRIVPQRLWGLVPMGALPYYSRMEVELTTTPVQADAGADVMMVYDDEAAATGVGKGGRKPRAGEEVEEGGIGLFKENLPRWWWPAPALGVNSPFGLGNRDYVRVCGPGVYVGCSYPPEAVDYEKDAEFIYFVMARSDPVADGSGWQGPAEYEEGGEGL